MKNVAIAIARRVPYKQKYQLTSTSSIPISLQTHHCDTGMQKPAVPEPVAPSARGGHHAWVILCVLHSNLLLGQLGSVVARDRVLLEPRAVGWRIKLGWLLEHNGLAATRRSVSHADRLRRHGHSDSAPELALQRQQKARDDCFGSHGGRCWLTMMSVALQEGRQTADADLAQWCAAQRCSSRTSRSSGCKPKLQGLHRYLQWVVLLNFFF